MFEILPKNWNLKLIFIQKWVPVDINWRFNPQPPTIPTLTDIIKLCTLLRCCILLTVIKRICYVLWLLWTSHHDDRTYQDWWCRVRDRSMSGDEFVTWLLCVVTGSVEPHSQGERCRVTDETTQHTSQLTHNTLHTTVQVQHSLSHASLSYTALHV